MKSFFAGLFAAIVGAITLLLLFFKKGSANIEFTSKSEALDKKADEVKSEIKVLESNLGKPVEDKSLESELDYWNKEKK